MRMTTKIAIAMMMAASWIAKAQQSAMQQALDLPGVEAQTSASLVPVQQVKDELFAGTEKFATGATDVTEINLDPKTMGMVGKTDGKDGDLAKKMRTMVIHTYKYDKPGLYKMEDVDAYRKKLDDGSWNCSIHVRTKTSSTDICTRVSPDHQANEMVIIAAEPLELTFIHMRGRMSLDDLSKMSGEIGGDKTKIKVKEK
jgi:hypothetical protein